MILKKVGRSVLAAAALVCFAAVALAQVPTSQHVILIINENHSYSEVVADMPWLIGEGNANGYATNYKSDNGGSLMDYLWLASGSCESKVNCTLPSGTHDFGCNGNDCSSAISDDNIFREMNNAGVSWKVYAQSYSAAGGTPTTPDNNNGTTYYRRHNGATWYSDILNNTDGSKGKVVDLSQLTTDLDEGNLPRFMIIVPDGNHDAHDCPVGMSSCTTAQQLSATDTFLNNTLSPILATSDFQAGGDGLVIVTFDECGDGTDDGCGSSVYTALIGPKVKPHTVSSKAYKHENALRTILDSLGIHTYPGASATATDMSDFFSSGSNAKPTVTVSEPVNGSSMGSPVTIQASATASSGHSITGWWIYVDSVGVYNGGATTTINPSVSMSTGTHTVLVRAWDTSGNYGDQTLTITVNTSKPTVSISKPSNNSSMGSPVNLQASATPSSGQSITGWWVYVDSLGVYNPGAVKSINTNLTMSKGTHTVLVRAWDTSGNYGDETITVTVSSTSTKPTVTITSPTGGSSVSSPIDVKASATASSGRSITGWWVYLDSVGVYNPGAVNSINKSISALSGTHTLLVRAWDDTGAYGDKTITVTVK
ncbi:MAG TPA: alkaline phosphatase family protein [Dongiaceae bacterium]|nr:alkaline phosphatase family protein [Dongiaceae bacterium]